MALPGAAAFDKGLVNGQWLEIDLEFRADKKHNFQQSISISAATWILHLFWHSLSRQDEKIYASSADPILWLCNEHDCCCSGAGTDFASTQFKLDRRLRR
ncbi:hypothetical protein [Parasphingorhabdus sp.]|uniref:hypothetical protein n=1 Tax=Parasphingorhabdus sp. TaxID=2709688 RepID=UPI003593F01A